MLVSHTREGERRLPSLRTGLPPFAVLVAAAVALSAGLVYAGPTVQRSSVAAQELTATPTGTATPTNTPTPTSTSLGGTLVVNSTGDDADSNTGDVICDDGTGACTLRAAIQQANASPGADIINFGIGFGAQTISVGSSLLGRLPSITDLVTIDGTTQPGFIGAPLINVNGTSVACDPSPICASGLKISTANSTVRGLTIEHFPGSGIEVSGGGNVIEGNFIEANFWGILVGSSNNVIGGTVLGKRNVISGNTSSGIVLNGDGNLVQGNLIGVMADGAANGNGPGIAGLGSSNTIGGAVPGAGNVIAHNAGGGILFSSTGTTVATNNTVSSNSIHDNAQLGIDLQPQIGQSGVTPNDLGDGDTGVNSLQNFPVLSNAENVVLLSFGVVAKVHIDFNSAPDTLFRFEFFASDACDPSGYGEGQTLWMAVSLATDENGDVTVFGARSPALLAGTGLTATATSPGGNTSEFSNCVTVVDTDTDGDGCTDVQEAALSPLFGGDRDPRDPWDFYDVDGTKSITLSDTLLILEHFGHAHDGDGLDPFLDRYVPDLLKPWRSAEALNGITLADALANLKSFGHSCAGV